MWRCLHTSNWGLNKIFGGKGATQDIDLPFALIEVHNGVRIEASMASARHRPYASGIKVSAVGVLIDYSVVFMASGFLQYDVN